MGRWVLLLLAICCAAGAQDDGDRAAATARLRGLIQRVDPQWIHRPDTAGARSGAAGTGALPVLLQGLKSNDPHTRLRALEGLAQTGDARQAGAFMDALADPSPEVRALAARVLAQLDPVSVFESVMALLSTSGPEALAHLDEALPTLRMCLEEKTISVVEDGAAPLARRRAAVYALGRMQSAAAMPLLARLAWAAEASLALQCADALISIADPVAVAHVARLCGHPTREVRWRAVEGLAWMGGPDAVAALGGVAIDCPAGDLELGRRALTLLGTAPQDQAIVLLVNVMRRNLKLRREAAGVLRQMTGEDLGDLPSAWLAWHESELLKRQNPASQSQPSPFVVEYYE